MEILDTIKIDKSINIKTNLNFFSRINFKKQRLPLNYKQNKSPKKLLNTPL